MSPPRRSARAHNVLMAAGIVVSVVLISVLHYLASTHFVLVHEILKRSYYVPIVVGAIHYGAQGGLATSLVASALYLPHIVMSWRAWPVFEVGQYGEIVLFNVVGAVTGVMADRLRSERNRYREASEELEEAYQRLEASTDQRIKAERMATVGRVAAGVAHEIRTPISAILGCFEILAGDYPAGHPKREFIDILKKEITKAETVVTTFLDLARPAPAIRRAVDLNEIAAAATRRFTSTHEDGRVASINMKLSPRTIPIAVDADQVERAVAELLMAGSALAPNGSMSLSSATAAAEIAEIRVRADGLEQHLPRDVFEAFDDWHLARGLMLPLIRQLIENQGGTIRAETHDSHLDVVIQFRISRAAAVSAALSHAAAAS